MPGTTNPDHTEIEKAQYVMAFDVLMPCGIGLFCGAKDRPCFAFVLPSPFLCKLGCPLVSLHDELIGFLANCCGHC